MSDINDVYTGVANVPSSFLTTQIDEFIPHPTNDQIANGKITRYFVRKVNDPSSDVIEVDQSTFQSLKSNHMYQRVQLDWRITGAFDDIPGSSHPLSPTRAYTGVLTANKLALMEADKDLPGLKYKIQNFKQFWVRS